MKKCISIDKNIVEKLSVADSSDNASDHSGVVESQGEQHAIWNLANCDISNLRQPVDQSVNSPYSSPGHRLDVVPPDTTQLPDRSNFFLK